MGKYLRPRTILSALSPLLCVAAVALWARSYAHQDIGAWVRAVDGPGRGRTLFAVEARLSRGRLWVVVGRFRADSTDFTAGLHWRQESAGSWTDPEVTPVWSFLTIGYGRSDDPIAQYGEFQLPWPLLVLISGVFSTIAIKATLARYRRSRRASRGLCPSCGYDLRATAGRCPECGNASAEC